ncbi:MAG TPA: hypothetical protein PK867_25060, partial [Pirellulales bacterium]|nr:hypothetical protein [Pirellulales bacterium]
MDAEIGVEYWDEGEGRFEIHYDAVDGPYKKSEAPVPIANSKRWNTARFTLRDVRFANRQNGKADFRVLAIGTPLYLKRVTVRPLPPGVGSADPWLRLAIAYALTGDTDGAVKHFAGAIDDASSGDELRAVVEAASRCPGMLERLQSQRPDDVLLQVALAVYHAGRGTSSIAARPVEGQAEFDKARDVFAGLSSRYKRVNWTSAKPSKTVSAGGATLTPLADGSVLAGGNNPDQDTYTISLRPGRSPVAAIRLETLPDDSLPNHNSGRALN